MSDTNRTVWRFAALLVAICVAIALWRVLVPSPPDDNELPSQDDPAAASRVTIEIDLGDGSAAQKFDAEHHEGMTVIDAMAAAARQSPEFSYQNTGSGQDAFVDEIMGTAGGEDGRYWLFEVNGERAELGAGIYRLQPGDRVLWKLAEYE